MISLLNFFNHFQYVANGKDLSSCRPASSKPILVLVVVHTDTTLWSSVDLASTTHLHVSLKGLCCLAGDHYDQMTTFVSSNHDIYFQNSVFFSIGYLINFKLQGYKKVFLGQNAFNAQPSRILMIYWKNLHLLLLIHLFIWCSLRLFVEFSQVLCLPKII